MKTLGTNSVGLDGWTAGTDGMFSQDSATEAGELLLPLSVSLDLSVIAMSAIFLRAAAGEAPATEATFEVQRRIVDDAIAWETDPGWTLDVQRPEDSRVVVLRLSRSTSSTWTPRAGVSYRLRITGEDGANASPLSLYEVTAA